MASELKVNTLTGVSTAGSIAVTGEGNSTTTNLQQGLAKHWCNWATASSYSIHDSFNTTGLTDNGTGDTTVTITNDFSSNDYANPFSNATYHGRNNNSEKAAGSARYFSDDNSHAVSDASNNNMSAHGDLA